MSSNKVVHLHNHTEFSTQDGASSPKQIAARAKAIESPACAITDHGNMAGWDSFYNACNDYDIKPILGVEAYLVDESDESKRKNFHQVLLAMNQEGINNLRKLSLIAADNFYYKPRIYLEELLRHNGGIIATSSCLGGMIPKAIMSGDHIHATDLAVMFKDTFGERFFLELQHRNNVPEQLELNRHLVDLGKRLDIPVIVTSDSHYAEQSEWKKQSVLQMVSKRGGNAKEADDSDAFGDKTFYLVDPDTLTKAFTGTDAVKNTLLVADMVSSVKLYQDDYVLPHVPIPLGYDYNTYLEHLVMQNYDKFYRRDNVVALERIRYELDVIIKMNMSKYFLFVYDIVRFANESNIYCNTRGSAAGSIVCYIIGISFIDPLTTGLYFERFLNPSRVTMPDIDLDFEDDSREKIAEYILGKYGQDNVAGIMTIGKMHAKQAIRDATRIREYPIEIAEEMTKLVPFKPDFDGMNEVDWLNTFLPEYRKLINSDERYRNVHEDALELSGLTRQFGQHPAGLIVTPEPVWKYVPIMRAASTTNTFAKAGIKHMVSVPHSTAEKVGLLKVDLLGLSTLKIVRNVCEKHNLTLTDIPFTYGISEEYDKGLDRAFDLIQSGYTAGVFQLEGEGMTQVLKQMRPSTIEHLIALVALYRPGPMQYIPNYIRRMHGEEPVTYRHEKLEPILRETYGICVFQEQIMSIATDLFGYSPSESDMIRKAIAKSNVSEMKVHEDKFYKNGIANGLTEQEVSGIWSDIVTFANYAFNKAHAASYGVMSLRTAYLKANYTTDYMAALMQKYNDDETRLTKQISECFGLGIQILPPHIVKSDYGYVVEGNKIRTGFSQIKGIGIDAASKVVDCIRGIGKSEFDEIVPVLSEKINKGILEKLINAGCFDTYHKNRKAILQIVLDARKTKPKSSKKKQQAIMQSIFDFAPDLQVEQDTLISRVEKNHDWYTPDEVIQLERDLFRGITFVDNPDNIRSNFVQYPVQSVSEIYNDVLFDGKKLVIGGRATSIKVIVDRNGNDMAFFTINDFQKTGSISAIAFASVWKNTLNMNESNYYVFVGKYDESRDQIIINEVHRINIS